MLPTEIADLLLSPERYSFNTSPEKRDLLPHHRVILTTTEHMHKNLVVLSKAINARAVRECNKKKKKRETEKRSSLSASSPRCRDESERTVCLCHGNAESSWWLWPYHCQGVQREDTPCELCLVSILKELCSESWKEFRIRLTQWNCSYRCTSKDLRISCPSSLLGKNEEIRT